MCNLQEGRHDLARHVFHGRRGDLRRAYHEGMEDQLGALGPVLNCITLWNTAYKAWPGSMSTRFAAGRRGTAGHCWR